MCLKDPFHLLSVHLPVFDKLRTESIVYPSPKSSRFARTSATFKWILSNEFFFLQ